MNDSCCPNTTTFPSSTIALTEANGLLTSASRNFILHFIPSRMNSNLASPSTRMGLPFAAANFTAFFDFVLSTPFFRLGQTLFGRSRVHRDLHYLLYCLDRVYFFVIVTFDRRQCEEPVFVGSRFSFRPFPPDICTSFSSNKTRIHRPDLREFY